MNAQYPKNYQSKNDPVVIQMQRRRDKAKAKRTRGKKS